MSDKRIEVDIAAAVALLQESPELCEVMNKLVGVPALDAALAEIELLRAERDAAKSHVIDLEEIVKGVHFLRKQAEAERDALRALVERIANGPELARAALAPSPAGPDGRNLAVLYCLERAEADVKLLREALDGMIAVVEGRFDGNPHADIDALAKARTALAPSPAGREE